MKRCLSLSLSLARREVLDGDGEALIPKDMNLIENGEKNTYKQEKKRK